MIREIHSDIISDTVKNLFIEANLHLPKDIVKAIEKFKKLESNPTAQSVFCSMEENISAAKELNIPICQDIGMAVVFLKIGQDVHIVGDNLVDAVNKGVSKAYTEGLLRKSVVADPILRGNTGDNTPAIIHTEIVPGDKIEITASPKGFGSENMSFVKMLTPSKGRQGVVDAVLDIVKSAGSNPCPPMVVGVGIGGDFEQSAFLSKKALIRGIDVPNDNPFYAELERELLEKINELDIGPQGLGGNTTALGVNIEYFATHIAGLPVAVNIGCHVTRHKTAII